ncbi:hypothetical protein SK128_007012 [Halocaridina rubra]|uniref:Uncharacterized protein n=1 Tax=Halocaridina rubra TaxID=373956 RepID=A0AAN9AE08_HALRR
MGWVGIHYRMGEFSPHSHSTIIYWDRREFFLFLGKIKKDVDDLIDCHLQPLTDEDLEEITKSASEEEEEEKPEEMHEEAEEPGLTLECLAAIDLLQYYRRFHDSLQDHLRTKEETETATPHYHVLSQKAAVKLSLAMEYVHFIHGKYTYHANPTLRFSCLAPGPGTKPWR